MMLARGDPETSTLDPVDAALQSSQSSLRTPRMFDAQDTSAIDGSVHWKPAKSLWISGMTLTALVTGPMFFTLGALVLFLCTTAITVCLGHSLGMHRRLIHRSYDCPLWLERLFVYLGTLVGMAGPYGMNRRQHLPRRTVSSCQVRIVLLPLGICNLPSFIPKSSPSRSYRVDAGKHPESCRSIA